MPRTGPKPAIDVTRFRPSNRDQQDHLFVALVDAGTGPITAFNIVRTLVGLPESGWPNALRANLSRYRKELAKLDGPPWERARVTGDKGGYRSSNEPEPDCRLVAFPGERRPPAPPEMALAAA